MTKPNSDIAAEVREAHAAGWLLHLMERTGNLASLGHMLAMVGLAMDHRKLDALADRLKEDGLIVAREIEGFGAPGRIVELTRDGRELLDRYTQSEWVVVPDRGDVGL